MSNKLKKNSFCLLAIIVVSVLSMPATVLAEDRDLDRERPRHGMHQRSEEILEKIAENDPEKAEGLRKLRDEDPEAFGEQMHRYMEEKLWQTRKGKNRRNQPREPDRPDDKRGMQGFGATGGRGGMTGRGGRPGHFQGKGGVSMGGMTGRGGKWKERMQKKHEEFVEWLGKNYPKEGQGLEKLKDKDPGQYIKQVFEKLKKYGEIMEVEKKNPEYAKVLKEDLELKQTRDSLMRKLKNADADQKEVLQAELKDVVSERFDIVIKKKEFKYKHLKQKLEKLQKQVANRQAELDKLVQSKDKAIADRMKELVGESEKLNWD